MNNRLRVDHLLTNILEFLFSNDKNDLERRDINYQKLGIF